MRPKINRIVKSIEPSTQIFVFILEIQIKLPKQFLNYFVSISIRHLLFILLPSFDSIVPPQPIPLQQTQMLLNVKS